MSGNPVKETGRSKELVNSGEYYFTDITLHNVCAVHRGMFSTLGGTMSTVEGYSRHLRALLRRPTIAVACIHEQSLRHF